MSNKPVSSVLMPSASVSLPQVPALTSPRWSVAWEMKDGTNPFLSKLLSVVVFYHSNRKVCNALWTVVTG